MIPVWFAEGRIILISKSSDSFVLKDFRPITCLNVLYKLWTACISYLPATAMLIMYCILHRRDVQEANLAVWIACFLIIASGITLNQKLLIIAKRYSYAAHEVHA